MFNVLKWIFGSKNDRQLKQYQKQVQAVNALETEMQALEDADFPEKIAGYKAEVAAGTKTLDDILPEVFALVREASVRVLGMRHYDVQLIGGMVLHSGVIAEMKTGEGKTLVATLPVVLNAISGKGVHVITVNDYLASRDAKWMGQLYNFLGLTYGVVVHGLNDEERQIAYGADITYGTNNEFGFDYLRDNMKFYKEHLVQRELNFAIVDEVDSILVDEARTPLIISGPGEESTEEYARINAIVPSLKRSTPRAEDDKTPPDGDYDIDEKARTVHLTERGVQRCEEVLGIDNLYDPQNITLQHHVLQALKAHNLFRRDVDYIVKEGEVVIVDEFTGRLMPGRRFSDGLHQALEAKEHVKVEAENQTLASITFQNYFRMYNKLGGMTGTADTEAVEFGQIYDLGVVVIPTHMEMIRKDYPDCIYKTQQEKYKAIADEIEEANKNGQPTLVGTISIEKSELISRMLTNRGVPHNVLNAKQHDQEALIVAEAGKKGRVTIATNMAGRGTDIQLDDESKECGGLYIIGTERHESRRIDNQLRGRSGRQGDPGVSRFFLALDDELMRLFGSDRIAGLMDKMGMDEGQPIENKLVSRAIENSQKRVEGHNFEIRKQLLDFDNVMNQQREVVYSRRRDLMYSTEFDDLVDEFVDGLLEDILSPLSEKNVDADTREIVRARLDEIFDFGRFPEFADKIPTKEQAVEWVGQILDVLREAAPDHYQEIVRYFAMDFLDRHWKEHLLNMDHLRDGIGLRGYGQKDPKQEYKREGFALFQEMLYTLQESTIRALCHLRIKSEVNEDEFRHGEAQSEDVEYSAPSDTPSTMGSAEAAPKEKPKKKQEPIRRAEPKVGRNDPCFCGSGKKYKKCCGK
ncbi:MAG: preprotein translocase subunit SecA [Desulfovibrio sp.]